MISWYDLSVHKHFCCLKITKLNHNVKKIPIQFRKKQDKNWKRISLRNINTHVKVIDITSFIEIYVVFYKIVPKYMYQENFLAFWFIFTKASQESGKVFLEEIWNTVIGITLFSFIKVTTTCWTCRRCGTHWAGTCVVTVHRVTSGQIAAPAVRVVTETISSHRTAHSGWMSRPSSRPWGTAAESRKLTTQVRTRLVQKHNVKR